MSYIGKAPNVNRLRFNPRSTDPANPVEGDVQYADGSARGEGLWVYKNGVWERVNQSTGSGINYAVALFDGLSTAGLNTYNDGASAVPVDGTGGTVTGLTTSINSSTPLRGLGNQRFSKDAANRQGEGWSWDFTLDRADYLGAKPVVIQFRYRTSAALANNDIRLFVYDRDGAQLLTVTSLNGDGSIAKADNTGLYTGVFYPNSANNDYRLIWHIASTNASAWDLDVIDLQVGPDMVVPGAIVTAWEAYTPTFTGLGTVSSVEMYWRRNGDKLELEGSFTVGTATATEARVSLPTSLTSAAIPSIRFAGRAIRAQATATTTKNAVVLIEPSVTYVTFGLDDYTQAASPFTKQNGNVLFGAQKVSLQASVPIAGWSASAALSTTETMLANAKVQANIASFSVPNNSITTVTGWTEFIDPLNSFDTSTGIFTAPKTGDYFAQAIYASSGNATGIRNVYITKNGTATADGAVGSVVASAAAEVPAITSRVFRLNAGDTLRMRVFQNSGGSLSSSATAEATMFSVVPVPDLSIFSVYGQTEALPTSGYSSAGLVNYTTAAGQFGDVASITLQPGEYDAFLQADYFSNGATTTDQVLIGISTTSGNSGTGLVEGDTSMYAFKTGTSGARNPITLNVIGLVVTAPTTYYFKSFAGTSITNLQFAWKWRFRKVK